MSRDVPWERVREQTRKAVERSVAETAAVAGREGEVPGPGDLVALPESAAVDVEWALLGPDPHHSGHLLAVPVDLGALVASGDLAVPPVASGGGYVLRCRFALSLDPRGLSGVHRTGILPQEAMEEAGRKWSELAAGGEAGSELELEIDGDAEYQDWIDQVVAPAHRAVIASGRGLDVESGALLRAGGAARPMRADGDIRKQAKVPADAGPPRGRGDHRRASGAWLAAAAVLAVATGLLGYQARELRKVRAAGVPAAGSIANPVIVTLDPGLDVRGVKVVTLTPGASHLIFTISELGPDALAERPSTSGSRRYSMELDANESGMRVWRAEDLQVNELDEIWAGAPASLVSPGRYRLRLYLMEDGRQHLIQDLELRIRRRATP